METKALSTPSEKFERITVNQMLTLRTLHQTLLQHEVAKRRNQDLSSVRKQLTLLNEAFLGLCGERLLEDEAGRGKPTHFTETGNEVVELFGRFLEGSYDIIDRRRREIGKRLTAASTTGMLHVIARLWPKWRNRSRGAFELNLRQIRTSEVATYLRDEKVDLVFAGMINNKAAQHDYRDFEFLPWSYDHRVVLLSNHNRLPSDPVTLNDILRGKVALIIANHGIMRRFAELAFGGKMQSVNIVASVDDLGYGVGLLRNNIYRASMLAIDQIADAEVARQSSGLSLQRHEVKGLEDLTIMDGVFRRRGASQFSDNHPINVCWAVIQDELAHNPLPRRGS